MFLQGLTLLGIFLHAVQGRPETGLVALEPDDGSYPMETDDAQFETDSTNLFDSDSKKFDPYDPNYTEKGHKPGGLPIMSDTVFSLIILVYVSVAFCIVFFLFCWKANNGRPTQNGYALKQECPLMTNEVKSPLIERSSLMNSNGRLSKYALSPTRDGRECMELKNI